MCSHSANPDHNQLNDLHDLGLSVRGRTVPIPRESRDIPASVSSTPAITPKASAEVVIPGVHKESRVYVPPTPAPVGVVKGLTPLPVPLPADDFINRNEVPEQLAKTFDYIIGQLDMVSTTLTLFNQRMTLIEDSIGELKAKSRGITAIPTTTINNGVVSSTKPAVPSYTKAPLNADSNLLTNVFGWPKQNEASVTASSGPAAESQPDLNLNDAEAEAEDNDTYEDDYEDYSGSHSSDSEAESDQAS